MVVYGWHEVSQYFVQTGSGLVAVLIDAMNPDRYNKLPPDIKKVFGEIGEATFKQIVDSYETEFK